MELPKPGFPILGVFRLKGQPKQDGRIIVRSCKASQSPVCPNRMKHFSVDGTLLDAWASMKSFRPKGEDSPPPGDGGRNRAVDFRGERRLNETHESRTDPFARLARRGRGKEARLCYEGHVLMDNRQGLVVDVKITEATRTPERDAALDMLQPIFS